MCNQRNCHATEYQSKYWFLSPCSIYWHDNGNTISYYFKNSQQIIDVNFSGHEFHQLRANLQNSGNLQTTTLFIGLKQSKTHYSKTQQYIYVTNQDFKIEIFACLLNLDRDFPPSSGVVAVEAPGVGLTASLTGVPEASSKVSWDCRTNIPWFSLH